MISDILDKIMSWSFTGGFLLGLVCYRVYCVWKARQLDKAEPLPAGDKHHVAGISRIWVAGVIAVGVALYSIAETQDNANRVSALSESTVACQREFNETLRERSRIAEQNDRLSLVQRDALADWIHELLNPPPEIAGLNPSEKDRQEWGLRITERYYGIIRFAQQRQRELAVERLAHPLPEPTCGK